MANDQWFMRQLRLHLGLTQRDVAEASGGILSQAQVSAFERGADKPNTRERHALLRAFIARSAGKALEQMILKLN